MHRLFLLLLFPVLAFAQTIDVQEHMLKNGMRVLLVEDHTVPSICFFAYYRVGSRNEKLGYTGLSHLFEHMMFNGSKKYTPGEIDRILEAGGGYSNASTWNDLTNYWEEFNPDMLEKVLDVEADRMRALKLDNQNVEQERGIVMEERRVSMDNNVQSRMEEELYANAYVAHPYQNQVIGWMGDLANIKLEDAQMYFRTYYAPNNCTIILTGDFKSGNALKLIKKHLEPLAAQPAPREPNNPEPEQMGEKRIKFHKAAELPAVFLGYKSVAASDSDYVVANVLAQVLSRGESSRLYKRLVYEKQMCTEASSRQDEFLDPGLFIFYAQMKEGFTTEQAENEIYALLETIQKEGVKPEELQKAKNNAQADFVRRFKTNEGVGFVLGYYHTIHGSWKKALTAAQAYDNVTNERIIAFAKRIFNERKRTVVTLFPESTEAN